MQNRFRVRLERGSVYVIAEAGVNHDGDPELAAELVDAAAEVGADAVKFQAFRAEALATPSAAKADYQQRSSSAGETQLEMLQRLQLDREVYRDLVAYCSRDGIDFLASTFDSDSLAFLVNALGLGLIKVPSGEIINGPLLLEIARTDSDVILSTGMSTLEEIEAALAVLAFGYIQGPDSVPSGEDPWLVLHSTAGQRAVRSHVVLLHCTTAYPTPVEEVNLRAMDTLRDTFGLPVGLSDHTQGIAVSAGAVGRDACVIEKHFTLDRSLPGPDHAASLEPEEFSRMVREIRDLEAALGEVDKSPQPSELRNADVVRRSLVAACQIAEGEPFTVGNVAVKRPAGGLSPMRYWDILGKKASRSYRVDDLLVDPG